VATFARTGSMGPIWNLSLTHADVVQMQTATQRKLTVAEVVAGFLPPPADVMLDTIAGAVSVILDYISFVDDIGGDNGVDITGVYPLAGAIVTPHDLGAYRWLSQAAAVAVNVAGTLADFVIQAAHQVEWIGAQVCSSAGLAGFLIGNIPGALVGGLLNGLFHKDAPPIRGGIVADKPKDQLGGWNVLTMILIAPPGQIAVLGWTGLFCPQNGGGGEVYANTPGVGAFERLTLEHHTEDGTVSFRTTRGDYFAVTNDSWHTCKTDQPNPGGEGGWGRFFIEPRGDGQMVLRSAAYGDYVTVIPGRTPLDSWPPT
jgi:hypothetical protein